MKDILRLAGSFLVMLVTLILVNLIFVQALVGDYEGINMLLLVVYSVVVVFAAAYEGANRGAQDAKFTLLMEKQKKERGYVMDADEEAKLFKPAKGFVAALIGTSPAILLSIVALFVRGESLWVTMAVRLTLGEFLGAFTFIDQYAAGLVPWIYLPMSLIFPLFGGIGYLCGPRLWDRQVAMMEKAKQEKRRKARRRRKKNPNEAK